MRKPLLIIYSNCVFSFLEYVPGGSVGSCLRDHGKFDEEVTKSFTGQILEGLEYLHSKNIIHRVSFIYDCLFVPYCVV
jgi:serine/threonine protein kinase